MSHMAQDLCFSVGNKVLIIYLLLNLCLIYVPKRVRGKESIHNLLSAKLKGANGKLRHILMSVDSILIR